MSTTTKTKPTPKVKPTVDYNKALKTAVDKRVEKKVINPLKAKAAGLAYGAMDKAIDTSFNKTADAIQRAAERKQARERIREDILGEKRKAQQAPYIPQRPSQPTQPTQGPYPNERDTAPTDSAPIDYNDLGDYGWTPENEKEYQKSSQYEEEYEKRYNEYLEKQENESVEDLRGRRKWRYRAALWGAKYYAKSKARKAVQKKLVQMAAKRAAAAAARQAAQTAATTGAQAAAGAGAAAGGGAVAGATAAPTGGASILIYIAAVIIVWAAIEAIKFIRHPIQESKKWGKRISILVIIWTVIFVVFAIMLGVILFGVEAELENELVAQTTSPVSISKTGPPQVNNGEDITYTITIASEDPTGDVTVIDTIPEKTTFVRATGKVTCGSGGTCTSASRTLQWSSKENNLTPPINTSFTVTVKPTTDNIYVINIARGSLTAGSAGPRDLNCAGVPNYVCAYKNIVNHSVPANYKYWAWSPPGHLGVDLIARAETSIHALEPGVVIQEYYDTGGGNMYKIHDTSGRYHMGLHMIRRASVKVGQVVKRGDVLGYVGHTGGNTSPTDHLHYQVSFICNNQFACWDDPAKILRNWPSY
jgi:uncharacterized repeat protein (TIGR01451 family)